MVLELATYCLRKFYPLFANVLLFGLLIHCHNTFNEDYFFERILSLEPPKHMEAEHFHNVVKLLVNCYRIVTSVGVIGVVSAMFRDFLRFFGRL